MARLRYNNALGALGAALSSGGTTITFASAPAFATLAGGDYIPLVIDPPSGPAPNANFEVVYLTAYTSGATTGTISRAQEGTSAVAHASGAVWVCGPVVADFASGGPLTLLSTTTLASAGTFDVSSISGGYNDLIGVVIARGTNAAASDTFQLNFNADTGANYYREGFQAAGNAAISSFETRGSIGISCGHFPAASGYAGSFGVTEFTIYGYASTAWKKVMQWNSWSLDLTTPTSNIYLHRGGGFWDNTAAISRIQLIGASTVNLAVGSQLRIYGRL